MTLKVIYFVNETKIIVLWKGHNSYAHLQIIPKLLSFTNETKSFLNDIKIAFICE